MPFPNTKVIPARWDEHHRPVAQGAQTSTGRVRRYSSAGVFNETTGETDYPDPVDIYGTEAEPVSMRIVRNGIEEARRIGERQVIVRSYIVAVPASAPEIRIRDEVVVATASDPQFPDESLWVHDVRFGSQIWERDLVCQNSPPTTR